VSDAIDLLAKIIKSAIDYGEKLVQTLSTEQKNINKITEATSNQKGFYNNRWPQSRSDAFNTNIPSSTEWQAT
jgi:hypothetical protein